MTKIFRLLGFGFRIEVVSKPHLMSSLFFQITG